MTSWENCILETCKEKSTTTEASTTITTTAPLEDCPMDKMKAVKPKKLKDFKKIKTWEDCAAICQDNNKCTAWTYRPKMKKQKKTLLCSIYSKYQKFVVDKFTISGTNNCPPKLTTTKIPETTSMISEEEYEEAITE